MTMMTTSPEPLDRLIREALGEPVDPAPARHACRAALQLSLAEARRRARRRQAGLAVAASLAFTCLVVGQLGSNDFTRHVEAFSKNGHEAREYSYGLKGEGLRTYAPGTPGAVSEAEMDEIAQQRAAGEGLMVKLFGHQVGRTRHFTITVEFVTSDGFPTESIGVDGKSEMSPPELKAWFKQAGPGSVLRVMEYGEQHPPDAVETMHFNGLDWIVSSWRIHFAGLEEITYYRGLRADGVRSRDPKDF